MTLDEIERAITLAKSRGLSELECAIGRGRLKVIVRAKQQASPVPAPTLPAVRREAITTDYFGVFADAEPAVRAGDRVAEKQIVGFLVLGDIRFAIEAKKAGRLGAKHVAAGALVGYGETIFDYE